jgi:hypothetical protein
LRQIRLFLAIVVVLQSFISSPTSLANDEEYLDLAVQIVCPYSRGAGFQLDSQTVVTAKHVVEGCTQAKVINSSKDEVVGISVLVSDSKDLAYISIPRPVVKSVELTSVPVVGSQVFTVGSPIDGLVLSKGTVKKTDGGLSGKWLVLEIPADNGNSGGPVFSSNGLVGLVISKDEENGEVYAYSSEDVKNDFIATQERNRTGHNSDDIKANDAYEVLIPILVSATITFLLGLGIGFFVGRARKKEPKSDRPRIRIEI